MRILRQTKNTLRGIFFLWSRDRDLNPGPHPYHGYHRPNDDSNRKTDVFSS